jgi:hypothetical protein
VIERKRHQWYGTANLWIWLGVVGWLCGNGCAAVPYSYGRFQSTDNVETREIRFEYGRPQKVLDSIAWVTGLWSRILPMSSRVNSHYLAEETKTKLVAYLQDNELADVLVRVNQYDPKGEWRRLRENDRVGAGWRYSVGILSMVQYTLLPGRVFGGDQYNPFTNTLYLNSDVSAVALHEAAYAKDIHARMFPGSYAVFNEIPLLSMWRHTNGVNDVLGYALTTGDWNVERETYRVVYPQMGMHSMSFSGPFVRFWDGLLLSVAGAAAGHATGQIAIAHRTRERNRQSNESSAMESSEQISEDMEDSNQPSSEPPVQITKFEIERPIQVERR